MARYVVKRLLWMIPIVISVTILIFTIMYFVPGDVVKIKLGNTATEEQVETVREQLGLNKPYIVRLGNYLSDVFLHFDFGNSLFDNSSVTQALMERFPRTFVVAILSTLLGAIIGTPLGVTAATHPNSWRDYGSMLISLIGVSMPGFWFALLLVLLFSVKLGWLPSQGMGGIKYFILPCVAAGFGTLANQARYTRACVIEELRADYVVTARSKGATEKSVIYKHALPNAAIPIITQLFGSLAMSMAGNLIIEQIFGIPGIGVYLINAINNRDYPAVQGAVVFFSLILCLMNLLTDVVYAYVDPRIKAQFEGKSRKKGTKEAE